MITIHKINYGEKLQNGDIKATMELRGLSTETKPSKIENKVVDNGSVFIEIDTGKLFFYDAENEEWKGE